MLWQCVWASSESGRRSDAELAANMARIAAGEGGEDAKGIFAEEEAARNTRARFTVTASIPSCSGPQPPPSLGRGASPEPRRGDVSPRTPRGGFGVPVRRSVRLARAPMVGPRAKPRARRTSAKGACPLPPSWDVVPLTSHFPTRRLRQPSLGPTLLPEIGKRLAIPLFAANCTEPNT